MVMYGFAATSLVFICMIAALAYAQATEPVSALAQQANDGNMLAVYGVLAYLLIQQVFKFVADFRMKQKPDPGLEGLTQIVQQLKVHMGADQSTNDKIGQLLAELVSRQVDDGRKLQDLHTWHQPGDDGFSWKQPGLKDTLDEIGRHTKESAEALKSIQRQRAEAGYNVRQEG